MNLAITLETGLSLLALKLLRSDQVDALATLALGQGLDSPRLRQLAGGSSPDDLDPRDRLTRELIEIGVQLPSPADAARRLARAVSSDIVAQRVDAFEAARFLSLVSRAVPQTFHELDPFIYAESEGEDRPSDREFFRTAIVNEARRWVQKGRGSV
jgi:hypothetical protein